MQISKFALFLVVFSAQCCAMNKIAVERVTVVDKSLNEDNFYYVLENKDIISCDFKSNAEVACKPIFTVDGRYCKKLTITDDTHSAWNSFYCPSYWAIDSLRKIGVGSQFRDFFLDSTVSVGGVVEMAKDNRATIKKSKNKGVVTVEYVNLNLRVGIGNQGLRLDKFTNPDDQLVALQLKLDHGKMIYEKYKFKDNREVEVFLKYNILGYVESVTSIYADDNHMKKTNVITYSYHKINKMLNIEYPRVEKSH